MNKLVVAILLSIICAFSYVKTQATPQLLPEIDFSSYPTNDNKVIALTFDDGFDFPKQASTAILNQLNRLNLTACFFMNSINAVDINYDTEAQQLLRDIVSKGHTIGSHTARHKDLSVLDEYNITKELTDIQMSINNVFAPNTYPLKLFRAPWGSPYNALGTAETRSKVKSIVGKDYVHIGWSIDSFDYNCRTATNPTDCVVDNILHQVDTENRWGIVLLHSLYTWTADAIPLLYNELTNRGFRFVSVEDIVKSVYGFNSRELYNKYRIEGVTVTPGYYQIPIGGWPHYENNGVVIDNNPSNHQSSTGGIIGNIIVGSSSNGHSPDLYQDGGKQVPTLEYSSATYNYNLSSALNVMTLLLIASIIM